MPRMDAAERERRWFDPAPNWLAAGLLAATGFLFLSEKFRWFGFNSHKGWTVLVAVVLVGVALLAFFLWWGVGLIFRLRFQFSIRFLLALFIVVALPFAWFAAEVQRASAQRRAADAITRNGSNVFYDSDGTQEKSEPAGASLGAAWLDTIFGKDFFGTVVAVSARDDSCLAQLKHLPCVHAIRAPFAEITDSGLRSVAAVRGLEKLDIEGSAITDDGLRVLGDLTELRELRVGSTRITDNGLWCLRKLNKLETVDLDGNGGITDAGMNHLRGLLTLRRLFLGFTRVTDAGVEELSALQELEEIDLNATRVGDRGLKAMQAMRKLRVLKVAGTEVTDVGIGYVSELPEIHELNIVSTAVTDAGLRYIARLKKLRLLRLGSMFRSRQVTSDGIGTIQKSIPDCCVTN